MINIVQIIKPKIFGGKKTAKYLNAIKSYVADMEQLGCIIYSIQDTKDRYFNTFVILGIEKHQKKPYLYQLKKYNPNKEELSSMPILFRNKEKLIKYLEYYPVVLNEYRRVYNLTILTE